MTDLHLVPEDESNEPQRSISPALRYYAAELKRFREAAGLTQAQLAEVIPYSKSMISMVETARRTPLDARDGDRVMSKFTECCDEALDTGGALSRILPLLEDASDPYPSWFRPYAALEAEATAIYTFQSQTVPGLFQTEAYARAVLGCDRPYMGDAEVDRQTTARIQRQQVFRRESRPTIFAIIDEVVVRRPIGGAAVLREQLERLIALAQSHVVNLGIMPINAVEHAGLDGSWNLLDFVDDDSLLYIEAGGAATMSNQAKDVLPMRQAFGALCMQALAPCASVELMMGIARDL
ncbi:hypothetical protein BJF83_00405 [Nocardiopsis sp. CNR-923]|uniref:helix-turn-helix domain-containing protein n=1 Tax=Nocardiopsis sp. CNR-923 TaxID=1904965 RepID=UPI00095B0FB7|nr:helix-turn-helix transcriptional regulator [Nocardiopsis sp. CNR-923]OLT29124.1 hypothetical protein BJF83_00405 [Nocardiopsis sp. CNR-923]